MKYRKIAKLGKGGMANVSLAGSDGPGGFQKLVVIKELKPDLAEDPEFLSMFLDEARVSARLQHPNIVHTYDVVSEGNEHYIVMEYLDGEPLNRIRSLGDWRKLPLPLHLRAISEALAGLHHAHELSGFDGTSLGLVHRDVSPHNIIVQFDGQVKLLDFGVAKVRGAMSTTTTGVVKGKLAYMAPEVLLGQPIDRRADIFAAGVMLWEAIARRKINKDRSDVELTGARVSGVEPALKALAPDAPGALVEICERAKATNPGDRYATALELKEAIDREIPAGATTAALGSFVSEGFASRRENVRARIREFLSQSGTRSSLPTLTSDVSVLSHNVMLVDSKEKTEEPEPSRFGAWRHIALAAAALLLTGGVLAWVATRSSAEQPVTTASATSPSDSAPTHATTGDEVALVADPSPASSESAHPSATGTEAAATAMIPEPSVPLARPSAVPTKATRSRPSEEDEPEAEPVDTAPKEGTDLAKPPSKDKRPIYEDDPYAQ